MVGIFVIHYTDILNEVPYLADERKSILVIKHHFMWWKSPIGRIN